MMHEVATQWLTSDATLPTVSVLATLGLCRATYYRQQTQANLTDPDLELRDHIQQLALEWPQYGYRRITAELHRQGISANHKRLLRLMRDDNLFCLRKRRFLSTTDSHHAMAVYPNLVPEIMLTTINQLWVAEIV